VRADCAVVLRRRCRPEATAKFADLLIDDRPPCAGTGRDGVGEGLEQGLLEADQPKVQRFKQLLKKVATLLP
jgi:hypothetical protein